MLIDKHYEQISKTIPNDIFVMGLYGSQNYNMATEDSDVDTVAIVFPTLDEIISNKLASETYYTPEGEHIVCKDIRTFLNELNKAANPSIELLFTKYIIVNPKYEKFWNELVEMREDIVHADEQRFYNATLGQMKSYYRMMVNDPKRSLKCTKHILRLQDTFVYYRTGLPFEECMQKPKSFYSNIEKLDEENRKIVADVAIANFSCKKFKLNQPKDVDIKSVLMKAMEVCYCGQV